MDSLLTKRSVSVGLFERSHWVFSPGKDSLLFLGPCLFVFLVQMALKLIGIRERPLTTEELLAYSVLINLPHVYATLFRTYFSQSEWSKRPRLLLLLPLFSFALLFFLFQWSELWALRFVAYYALYHHVRQQYGWMMITSKRAGPSREQVFLDGAMIYALCLIPLLYKHTLDNPSWFDAGDLIALPFTLYQVGHGLLLLLFVAYGAFELFQIAKGRPLNLGKYTILLSTGLAWYYALIWAPGPLAVLMLGLNHCLPYLYLVYTHEKKQSSSCFYHSSWGVLAFILLLILMSGAEEFLWAREKQWELAWGAVLFPLLYVPQLLHYILDGIIWRRGQVKS
jgi:hypothetical protein